MVKYSLKLLKSKKALMDDWTDVLVTISIMVLIVIFFGLIVNLDRFKIESESVKLESNIEAGQKLQGIVKMPISELKCSDSSLKNVYDQVKSLRMSDLFVLCFQDADKGKESLYYRLIMNLLKTNDLMDFSADGLAMADPKTLKTAYFGYDPVGTRYKLIQATMELPYFTKEGIKTFRVGYNTFQRFS